MIEPFCSSFLRLRRNAVYVMITTELRLKAEKRKQRHVAPKGGCQHMASRCFSEGSKQLWMLETPKSLAQRERLISQKSWFYSMSGLYIGWILKTVVKWDHFLLSLKSISFEPTSRVNLKHQLFDASLKKSNISEKDRRHISKWVFPFQTGGRNMS